jgi:hypothetical protein
MTLVTKITTSVAVVAAPIVAAIPTRQSAYGKTNAIRLDAVIYAGARRSLRKIEWSILLLIVFAADAIVATAALYISTAEISIR